MVSRSRRNGAGQRRRLSWAQPPDLYFLKDTNGDDKADKREVVLTGFGIEDRHELLNGFAWGPDGWLYMTHGVFTHSKVKDPNDPEDDGVKMDAALARFHPRTKKFEIFADGTSNPWGVDWNERGDAFVSACVIDHLFHMAPGGQYNRQGGTWANPYGYAQDLRRRDCRPSWIFVTTARRTRASVFIKAINGRRNGADWCSSATFIRARSTAIGSRLSVRLTRRRRKRRCLARRAKRCSRRAARKSPRARSGSSLVPEIFSSAKIRGFVP